MSTERRVVVSTERRVVLAPESGGLRRQVGPTAWVVFEELLLASTGTGDVCEASVSVRSLAVRLGVGKDTVARALSRLRRVGLVTACQSRTTGGVFATGVYALTVPSGITVTDHTAATSPRAVHRSASDSTRRTGQLTLTLTT